jgi:hypothetical protein
LLLTNIEDQQQVRLQKSKKEYILIVLNVNPIILAEAPNARINPTEASALRARLTETQAT